MWVQFVGQCGSRLVAMGITFAGQCGSLGWVTFAGHVGHVCGAMCVACVGHVSFGAIVLDEEGQVVGQLGDFCGSSWSLGLVIWVTVVGHLWHVCGSPVPRL